MGDGTSTNWVRIRIRTLLLLCYHRIWVHIIKEQLQFTVTGTPG